MKNHEDYETFKEISERIILMFEEDKSITLHPSKKLVKAFQFAARLIETEIDRRITSGQKGGRPRKPESELSKGSAAVRRFRDRKRAEQKTLKEP